MKYLRKFAKTSDYQTFMGGGSDYVEPHVVLVEETNSVSYKAITPTKTMISFTIVGTSYQAEEGMTWEQWVNSEYNTNHYFITGTDSRIYQSHNTFVTGYGENAIHKNDTIISAYKYYVYTEGGGE